MRGMEVTVVKKGTKPMDDDSLVEDAIREVAGRIDGYDADTIMDAFNARNAPQEGASEEVAEVEAPPMSKEECPDCAKGQCMRPEHMDEDMLRAMLAEKDGE